MRPGMLYTRCGSRSSDSGAICSAVSPHLVRVRARARVRARVRVRLRCYG